MEARFFFVVEGSFDFLSKENMIDGSVYIKDNRDLIKSFFSKTAIPKLYNSKFPCWYSRKDSACFLRQLLKTLDCGLYSSKTQKRKNVT